MMLFRFLALGLLIVVVYRTIRNAMAAVLGHLRQGKTEVSGKPKKKPSWDVNESQIQDAEFQDLDT